MSHTAISIENLSKAYRIGLKEEIPDTLLAMATSLARAPLRNWRRLRSLNTFGDGSAQEREDLFWALKDVSFDVAEGEVVGIIGRNGAGKSTLLKVLSRITEPTRGRGRIRGRVSSLLEVGTGFHPELSGRDNVYMNGTILGMSKREIDRKFDEIVEFSGVEKFLDTPVKRYSSGMKVRLAFAVAAHLEPEVLIIDEVLAVGDAEFQKKCLGKMQDVAGHGRTVLFVSHNMAAVTNLCTRGVVLNQGQVTYNGGVTEAIDEYMGQGGVTGSADFLGRDDLVRSGSGAVRIAAAGLVDKLGEPCGAVRMGEEFSLDLELRSMAYGGAVTVGIAIFDNYGRRICGLNSADTGQFAVEIAEGGEATVRCRLASQNLAAGRYHVNLRVRSSPGREDLDAIQSAMHIDVDSSDVFGTGRIAKGQNVIFLKPEWGQLETAPTA